MNLILVDRVSVGSVMLSQLLLLLLLLPMSESHDSPVTLCDRRVMYLHISACKQTPLVVGRSDT